MKVSNSHHYGKSSINNVFKLVLTWLLAITAQTTLAATFTVGKCGDSADYSSCDLYLDGVIEPGDSMRFLEYYLDTSLRYRYQGQTFLILNSDGGNLREAVELADTVQRLAIATNVKPEDRCNSSCVIILAGGVFRIPSGRIGIHRPYHTEETTLKQSENMFSNVEGTVLELLRKSGISPILWHQMITTPSHKIKYLSKLEKQEWGLYGNNPSYEDYSDGVNAKKHGITKQEFLKRKLLVDNVCKSVNLDDDDYKECLDQIYETGKYNHN